MKLPFLQKTRALKAIILSPLKIGLSEVELDRDELVLLNPDEEVSDFNYDNLIARSCPMTNNNCKEALGNLLHAHRSCICPFIEPQLR